MLVTSSPDVLSGEPVFAGTRVPVAAVIASLHAGIDFERLKASYQFLTDEHVQAAVEYTRTHPPGRCAVWPKTVRSCGWLELSRLSAAADASRTAHASKPQAN